MIEEIGTVVNTEPGYAWIETKVKTTCSSCVANDNCGTSVVAKVFTPRPEHLRIEVPCELQLGQSVKIGIPEQHLLSASAWVYLVPIVTLLASAALLQSLVLMPEPAVILLSFAFTFGAYYLVSRRFKSNRLNKHYQPIFLGATQESVMSRKNEIPVKKL